MCLPAHPQLLIELLLYITQALTGCPVGAAYVPGMLARSILAALDTTLSVHVCRVAMTVSSAVVCAVACLKSEGNSRQP